MKKVSMGLLHFVFMLAVILFLIVSLSACNVTGNVALNGKELIINKLKAINTPTIGITHKSDTSKVEDIDLDKISIQEITGDFRYENLFQ